MFLVFQLELFFFLRSDLTYHFESHAHIEEVGATWFHFFNFVTIGIVSLHQLFFLNIYKRVVKNFHKNKMILRSNNQILYDNKPNNVRKNKRTRNETQRHVRLNDCQMTSNYSFQTTTHTIETLSTILNQIITYFFI